MNTPYAPDFEGKLTPAAQQALDEVVSDYRQQVLLSAVQSAGSLTGEVAEITVRDVMAGVENQKGTRSGVSEERRKRLGQRGVYVGVVYTMLGLSYVGYRTFILTTSYLDLIGLVVALTGVGLILLSVGSPLWISKLASALGRPTQRKDDISGTQLSWQFLQYWQEIELILRNIASAYTGETTATKPISSLLSVLISDKLIAKETVQSLRELQTIRNRIVHFSEIPQPQQLDEMNVKAKRVIVELASLLG